MKNKPLFVFAITFLTFFGVNKSAAQTAIPFESELWEIDAQSHMLLEYQQKQALYLHNGSAVLNGPEMKNGVIDFKIAFSGERGFAGVTWRRADSQNAEYFYVRPHQSGKPDANQYTPVFNGISGWQLYHGAGFSAPTVYPMNQWIQIRIVSWQGQAKIYIKDMEEAAVEVPEMKCRPISGGIGLQTFVTPVYFADFKYHSLDEAPFEPIPPVEHNTPEGIVREWEISNPIKEDLINNTVALEDFNTQSLEWESLKSENTGIANLARLTGTSENSNTVFARLKIHSDSEQVKKMSFGYSDKVRVYINGQLFYSGDNTYRSRDFRYLGTIGLFDELYLPLQKGDNEIWFAVTESFGGWGIIGQLQDREGIQLSQ